jgi:hypothetical protein
VFQARCRFSITEGTMNAGTIFVLCLAAGFVIFVAYLAILSRRSGRGTQDPNERKGGPNPRSGGTV